MILLLLVSTIIPIVGRNMSRQDGGPACADDDDVAASSGVAPFLSVRTAFDLYLKALELPRGSLVVCSALTIPDMVSIFEEHGLVPLPVDIDPDTLAPEPGALEAEVERYGGAADRGQGSTGCVRAIYIAHVFGAQVKIVDIGICYQVCLSSTSLAPNTAARLNQSISRSMLMPI